MFTLSRKIEAFIDGINLALGGFLFLSPWIFGFTSVSDGTHHGLRGQRSVSSQSPQSETLSHRFQFPTSSKLRNGSLLPLACG